MAKVYVFLADGFEEVEALTAVDLLRRAGIHVNMVSISAERIVTGSHDIKVTADTVFADNAYQDGDMLLLPGGPGHTKLLEHEGVRNLLLAYQKEDKRLAAICAAPSILGMNGLLKGKRAVCYPGYEEKLLGAEVLDVKSVTDCNITTSRGLGTAVDFALEVIAQLSGKETADKISREIQYA